MKESLEDFRRLGAKIVVISFVPPDRLAQYLAMRPWPFPVLADPQRHAYRAFGLESAGWARLVRPRVILSYIRLILRGRVPRPAREDVHQLGGDFVLDRHGRIIFEYRSQDPADRPPVSDLLKALPRAGEPDAERTQTG